MTSATEQLRKLLDERGVKYKSHYLNTSWYAGTNLYMATDDMNGTLTVDNLTPEQAIAATLGDEIPKKCSTCQYRFVVGQRPYPTFGYMCGFGDGKKLCGNDTSVLNHMGCEHWEKELR